MPVTPGPWHYRQSIDYEITNNRAILDLASRYRETFLFNIWRMGMNSIEQRQQGLLDRHAQAHRRSASAAAGSAAAGGGAAARRPSAVPAGGDAAPAQRRRRAEAAVADAAAASRWSSTTRVLHDPKLRDPRGYILPADQPDFATATEFINALLKNGVTCLKATVGIPGGRQELSRRVPTW